MTSMKEKKLGIIGGMGPEATIYFYKKIIDATKVEKDQDHIHTLIDSNPQVPDRTKYILGEGPCPYSELLESLKLLEKCGVDLVAIPCNTAHYFVDDLRKEAKSEIVSIIEQTRDYVKKKYPKIGNVALLATEGTIKSKIYHRIFKETGFTILTPEKDEQDKLMDVIYKKIKKGKVEKAQPFLKELGEKMRDRGARVLIAGCTEIPLALENVDIGIPVIDPMNVTAKYIVDKIKS